MLGEETGMAPGAENILDLRATLIVSSAKQAVISKAEATKGEAEGRVAF
jgi:hypothetical protein